MFGGQGGSQQGQQQGGNFMDKEIDQFATKEGVPAKYDSTINKEVDKYL